MLTARELMTADVRCAEADWTLEELANFLTEHSISGAPVVDRDKTIGVVSATDLMRSHVPERFAFPDSTELLSKAADVGIAADELQGLHMEQDSGVRVRDIMTPIVYDVSEDTPAQEIADIMVRGRIHRVVVTRGGKAVGIISSLDLVRIVQNMTA